MYCVLYIVYIYIIQYTVYSIHYTVYAATETDIRRLDVHYAKTGHFSSIYIKYIWFYEICDNFIS